MTDIFTRDECLKLVDEYTMNVRNRTEGNISDHTGRGLLAVADGLCAIAFAILATTTTDPKPQAPSIPSSPVGITAWRDR
jgi:hypothetical protein